MGGSVVRGLLSPRNSSSLVCLTAHSFLPAPSSCSLLAPRSAGGGAVTFLRRASLRIRVPEHGVAGFGSGLRFRRSLLGVRALSRSSRGGGADALGVGVSKMSRRDPVVCSASSSAAETSSSENLQAPPKVRVTVPWLQCVCKDSDVEFVRNFDWIVLDC
jgi:hypothetical protein